MSQLHTPGRAVCLMGSARTGGSTERLIDAIMLGMRQAKLDAIKYCIGQCDIRYCLGCKRCYADGCCVQQDDVKSIVSDMLSADAVVIAAPSYWAGVPGQMKTFFDRCTPYGDTNENRTLFANHPIKGVAIAIRAGSRPQENELVLDAIAHFFGHLGIDTVKRVSLTGVDTPDDLLMRYPDILREMQALGQSILQD